MPQRISAVINIHMSEVFTSSKNGKSIDAEAGIATAKFSISMSDIPIINNIRNVEGSYASISPPKEASPLPPLNFI